MHNIQQQIDLIEKIINLRSAEPYCAAEPIPNSPRISASNLLRSAKAEKSELNVITAAANAVETRAFQVLDSAHTHKNQVDKN